jgi:hypothetical protein
MNRTRIKIYTNSYCVNIAENLKNMIAKHYSIPAMVISKRFDKIDRDTLGLQEYVILFQGLLSHQPLHHPPPANKYFIYQLEQLNKPHIYTENVEPILNLIEKSICTFDYSLTNMEYYPEDIRHKIKYLIPPPRMGPIQSQDTIYDILFYGLLTPRRRAILQYLSRRGYKVYAVEQVFGERLHQLILKSCVVLNLHNAEEAILETPRLHEVVHTGARIISEYPCKEDWKHVPEYARDRIHFIDVIEENLSNISLLMDALNICDTDKEQLLTVTKYLDTVNQKQIGMLAPVGNLR